MRRSCNSSCISPVTPFRKREKSDQSLFYHSFCLPPCPAAAPVSMGRRHGTIAEGFRGPSAGSRFISPLDPVRVVQGTQDDSRRSSSALQNKHNDESYSTCLVCWTGRRPHPPSFPKIGPVRSRLANTGAEPDRRLTACRLSLWWGGLTK